MRVDSSDLGIEEAVAVIVERVRARIPAAC
jgi:hypothetical protein